MDLVLDSVWIDMPGDLPSKSAQCRAFVFCCRQAAVLLRSCLGQGRARISSRKPAAQCPGLATATPKQDRSLTTCRASVPRVAVADSSPDSDAGSLFRIFLRPSNHAVHPDRSTELSMNRLVSRLSPARLSVGIAAAAMALSASVPALAFNPQPDPPGIWSMIGMVADQTARISVVMQPAERGTRAAPCTVTFNFLDSYGNKLTEATTLVLLPAVLNFVDLKGRDLRLTNPTDRMQFRAEVHVLHNPPALRQCDGVAANVEIFNGNGRTSLITNPSFLPPDPY
ncbi:MAG: hypothetical protein ABI564_05665 [Ideonella sp.]